MSISVLFVPVLSLSGLSAAALALVCLCFSNLPPMFFYVTVTVTVCVCIDYGWDWYRGCSAVEDSLRKAKKEYQEGASRTPSLMRIEDFMPNDALS